MPSDTPDTITGVARSPARVSVGTVNRAGWPVSGGYSGAGPRSSSLPPPDLPSRSRADDGSFAVEVRTAEREEKGDSDLYQYAGRRTDPTPTTSWPNPRSFFEGIPNLVIAHVSVGHRPALDPDADSDEQSVNADREYGGNEQGSHDAVSLSGGLNGASLNVTARPAATATGETRVACGDSPVIRTRNPGPLAGDFRAAAEDDRPNVRRGRESAIVVSMVSILAVIRA